MKTKILFARVGWMTYYAGPQLDDPRPVGGGAYNNQQNSGSELFNFARIKERGSEDALYGFVSPPKNGKHRINLQRIDPGSDGNSLAGVTVIFVARQKIVGWYRNATVRRIWKDDPTGERVWIERGRPWSALYNLHVSFGNAVLLPTAAREHEIPSGRNGFGQANVRYAYNASLEPALFSWMEKAVEYVNGYAGENILTNPTANVETKVADELEKSAGFQSNSAIRKAVEDHAMKRVERYYRRRLYSVWNTSKTKPYDLRCEKAGRGHIYVEVKGTQTSGHMIPLTHNEVELARDPREKVDLCVVHSIKITGDEKPKASGGNLRNAPELETGGARFETHPIRM
jgi:hypothetical protein